MMGVRPTDVVAAVDAFEVSALGANCAGRSRRPLRSSGSFGKRRPICRCGSNRTPARHGVSAARSSTRPIRRPSPATSAGMPSRTRGSSAVAADDARAHRGACRRSWHLPQSFDRAPYDSGGLLEREQELARVAARGGGLSARCSCADHRPRPGIGKTSPVGLALSTPASAASWRYEFVATSWWTEAAVRRGTRVALGPGEGRRRADLGWRWTWLAAPVFEDQHGVRADNDFLDGFRAVRLVLGLWPDWPSARRWRCWSTMRELARCGIGAVSGVSRASSRLTSGSARGGGSRASDPHGGCPVGGAVGTRGQRVAGRSLERAGERGAGPKQARARADEELCRSCHVATGGNPFYLCAATAALAAEPGRPTVEVAKRVRELGAGTVGRTVRSCALRASALTASSWRRRWRCSDRGVRCATRRRSPAWT